MAVQHSQLDPLPSNLPFRFISNTIGRGAFASIKKAIPQDADNPVFAVKLIHKAYAVKRGHISPRQITTEVALHSHIGQHPNVIEWFATGEDAVWRWIAMEFAEGGDLFDKIEADVGVPEDIAHLYFRQLVSGVSFVHSKGIAHRDLKPENILMSGSGNLKLADFGMATMFEYKGTRKQSSTTCGSPPYIAPEVLACGHKPPPGGKAAKYSPNLADIWSCGVILFVLLVGNTPWDEPVPQTSWEFHQYLKTNGKSEDELWQRIPFEALSLLRGMMNVDYKDRFDFVRIRQHPWFTRPNPLLTANDQVSDPLELATQMLGNLRIDLSKRPAASQNADGMDLDDSTASAYSATQPEAPIDDSAMEWERPGLRAAGRFATMSSTQPMTHAEVSRTDLFGGPARRGTGMGFGVREALADEPAMSQFSQAPGVPVSLTQHARRFQDIVPSYSLTRFFSQVPAALLVQMLCATLHELNVPTSSTEAVMVGDGGNAGDDRVARIPVRTVDGRKQKLHGEVLVDRCKLGFDGYGESEEQMQLLEVRFVKVKGDPLEWRRFFKKMAQLCREAIYSPEADAPGV